MSLSLISIGASVHDFWHDLDNERFLTSSSLFAKTIKDANLFGMNFCDHLDLFDSKLEPSEIIFKINNFLATTKSDDVILHFCCHGFISSSRRSYSISVRSTRPLAKSGSSLKIQDLWSDIEANIIGKRLTVIFDSCYAGEAVKEFMVLDHAPIVEAAVLNQVPPEGVCVICAADSRDVALAPAGSPVTLFTGKLIDVIQNGICVYQTKNFYAGKILLGRFSGR